jgi:hypothetical protein
MGWYFNEKLINNIEDIPEGCIGFIYKITNIKTGQYYIGKKSIYSQKTLPPLKGKKRKRKVISEMKWQEYQSSNELVQTWPIEDIEKIILRFCFTKKGLTYFELKEQFIHGVLEDDTSVNFNLLGKFYKRDIRNEIR